MLDTISPAKFTHAKFLYIVLLFHANSCKRRFNQYGLLFGTSLLPEESRRHYFHFSLPKGDIRLGASENASAINKDNEHRRAERWTALNSPTPQVLSSALATDNNTHTELKTTEGLALFDKQEKTQKHL